MAKKTLTVTLHVEGVRQTLEAFRDLPKDADAEIRDRAGDLAQMLADRAQAAGRREGRQARAVARTVKVRRDRLPVIIAGGSRKIGNPRAPAYALLFGSEFGMNRRSGWYAKRRYRNSAGRQYLPHRGRKGYWFFPTIEHHASDIADAWNKAADEVIRKFTEGGGV